MNDSERNAIRWLARYNQWRIPEHVQTFADEFDITNNDYRARLRTGIHLGHLIEMCAAWLLSEGRLTYPASRFEDAFGTTREALRRYRSAGGPDVRRERYGHTFDILTTVPAKNGRWIAIDITTDGDKRRGTLANVDAPNARRYLRLPEPDRFYVPKVVFALDHELWEKVADLFFSHVLRRGVPDRSLVVELRDEAVNAGLGEQVKKDPIFNLILRGANDPLTSIADVLRRHGVQVPAVQQDASVQPGIGRVRIISKR